MSTKLKDRQEKIEQIIAKLIEESDKGTPVVVEGKKDADNLRLLGIEGTIVTVKTGGKSFLDVVFEIEASGAHSVVLLLDFDRRGKQGTKRLVLELERLHIKADVRFWQKLHGLVGRDIQCIESLPNYLETIKAKTGT
ncbi:MAG: toprim domain-containing protein [Candidatus Bathyarchaeia archaeon]|jgi:2,5-diamino-6-(ribosylamino)-4(3H)-pyrimidinone 5'-phosphate reductase